MRKLKLQMQISVDGFVAGPNGELDWMTGEWDNELKKFAWQITNSFDTIILGRNMTDGFISHWTNVMKNPEDPDYEAAKKFIETPKVVFTKTLKKSKWENTTLAKGNLADEISKLKKQNGKDIIVYGGASFVSSLIKGGHIDEFNFFVNPIMINKGMRIFDLLEHRQKLSLISSTAYENGVVILRYKLDTKK